MYAFLLDQVIEQTRAERGALIARGVSEGLPTLAEAVNRFNEALAEVPARPTPQNDLRRALGLR